MLENTLVVLEFQMICRIFCVVISIDFLHAILDSKCKIYLRIK